MASVRCSSASMIGVGVDALGLHVDSCRADGRDANQEIRPLDFSTQGLRDGRRRLLDKDVRQAAAVEPGAEAILGGGTLNAAFGLGQSHPGVRFDAGFLRGFGIGFDGFGFDDLRAATSLFASAHWNRSPCALIAVCFCHALPAASRSIQAVTKVTGPPALASSSAGMNLKKAVGSRGLPFARLHFNL